MTESPASQPVRSRRRSCLLTIVVAGAVLVLVGGALWWWQNRPIHPVVLSPQEKAAVQQKVERIQAPAATSSAPAPAPAPAEPDYEKGGKEIIVTERELNGLLHDATGLGDRLRLELGTDVVHARIETRLDPGVPVLGGRMLKARARFFVRADSGRPELVLDDLTAWGVSLPNEWLGGLKGRDLIGEAFGVGRDEGGGPGLAGVEEFKVEPGRIRIRLKE